MNSENKYSSIAKIFVTMLLIGASLFFGFIFLIMLSISGTKDWVITTWMILCVDIVFILAIVIRNKEFLSKIRFIPVFVAIITITIICINGVFEGYNKSIPVLNEQSVNLGDYEPFKDESRIVRLKEESTLKLDGQLPRLDCATALYPVLSAFVEATYPKGEYAPYNNDSIFMQTNTADAYARLVKNEVDIILAAGPSESQLEHMKKSGIELNLTPIGKEAFVFFVNSKNPVKNLTIEQIQGIYSGEITNWKQIGGKDESIKAFQRPKNSGSQTSLEKLMDDKPLMDAPKEDIVITMGGIIDDTANYKNYGNAIGYSFRYFSTEMVKNKMITLINLNGIFPDKETIRTGEYPIASEFYAITVKGRETENVKKLISWMQSVQGQHIVQETGYVALTKVDEDKDKIITK